MAKCTTASYDSREEAVNAKRRILRRLRLSSNVRHCPECDKYHAVVAANREPLSERWIQILECLAQGYRAREIAPIVGMERRGVEWAVDQMIKRFYALSSSNLVAIVISLGIIDPKQFVPAESEKQHT